MGFNTITWAWHRDDLTPTQRLILLALADHANPPDYFVFAFPDRIARMTGFSKATVYRALSDLKKEGVLEDAREYDRDGWRLLVSDGSQSHSETEESHSETEESHSENPPILGTPQEPPHEPSAGGGEEENPAERVWRHYCSKPGKRDRPLPAQERKLINDVLKVATADELLTAIDACWASDYHHKRGRYRNREGQRYDKLTQIIKGRRGRETDRERIDFWLERAETSLVAGSGNPSVDPAVIARRKQEVQRGHRLKGDPKAVRKAEEAEAWLSTIGIKTERGPDGFPTFREGS